VCLGTAAVVRLKSPLHVPHSSKNVSTEKIKPIEPRAGCQGLADFVADPHQNSSTQAGEALQPL
jgi:hypothetical protein